MGGIRLRSQGQTPYPICTSVKFETIIQIKGRIYNYILESQPSQPQGQGDVEDLVFVFQVYSAQLANPFQPVFECVEVYVHDSCSFFLIAGMPHICT